MNTLTHVIHGKFEKTQDNFNFSMNNLGLTVYFIIFLLFYQGSHDYPFNTT
jgi:hypothetical protein